MFYLYAVSEPKILIPHIHWRPPKFPFVRQTSHVLVFPVHCERIIKAPRESRVEPLQRRLLEGQGGAASPPQ